jgi:hypothetical protein
MDFEDEAFDASHMPSGMSVVGGVR